MKNKFLKITILCICIVFVLSAATIGIVSLTKRDWKTSFNMMEEEKHSWGTYIAGTLLSYLELTENTDFDLMTVYDYETVSKRLDLDKLRWNSVQPYLEQYRVDFPIERIEAIDDTHVCIVYKLEDDQQNIVYSYVVFEGIVVDGSESPNQPATTSPDETTNVVIEETEPEACITETWMITEEFYYVSGTYSYSDYASIQVGDSYEKFAAIDPAVKCDYERKHPDGAYYSDGSCGFRSLRLIKDGLLVVEFEDPNLTLSELNAGALSAAEEHRVKSMQLYPWGTEKVLGYLHILNAEADSIELPN